MPLPAQPRLARLQLVLAGALLAAKPCIASGGEPATDPALVGCWRIQIQRVVQQDGKELLLNRPCAVEFAPREFRVACVPTGQATYAYELDSPGHWVAQLTRSDVVKGVPPPTDASYSIDERWLRIDAVARKGGPDDPLRPGRVESLLLRVAPGAGGACEPPPASKSRVGNSPESAIVLSPPEGFAPLLKDMRDIPGLAKVMGRDFLIGMFVPVAELAAAEKDHQRASLFVLATDDTSAGPSPLKPARFRALKAKLHAGARGEVTCDTERAICYGVGTGEGRERGATSPRVTSAFVNVQGRVVRLLVRSAPERMKEADRVTRSFIERLVADNPDDGQRNEAAEEARPGAAAGSGDLHYQAGSIEGAGSFELPEGWRRANLVEVAEREGTAARQGAVAGLPWPRDVGERFLYVPATSRDVMANLVVALRPAETLPFKASDLVAGSEVPRLVRAHVAAAMELYDKSVGANGGKVLERFGPRIVALGDRAGVEYGVTNTRGDGAVNVTRHLTAFGGGKALSVTFSYSQSVEAQYAPVYARVRDSLRPR